MRPLDVGKDNRQTCFANGAADLGERQEVSWGAEAGEQDVENLRRKMLHERLGEHSFEK